MHQNHLVSTVGDLTITIPTTAILREKWIGSMLDRTGRAYSGALRLDFSSRCVPERALNAVVDTLARHSILSAHFEVEGETLVGYTPTETELRQALREQLYNDCSGVTDESFLNYRGDPGLRLASANDDDGIHVWIGFCTYACDGASIDLLIEEISHRYLGQPLGPSRSWVDYAQMEIIKASKRIVTLQDRLDIYPAPGPYGLDAIRNNPRGSIGYMQSKKFESLVPRDILLSYARSCRVTSFVLLFTIYQRAISAVSGVKTIVTGVPFSNRQHLDEFAVVGPLSNVVPVTTHHTPGESLINELDQIQRVMIKAAERQDIEPAALYPEGISPRTVDYELPFPQLLNAWNSRREGHKIFLGKTEWMRFQLLPNGTCRTGFEITLDEHAECISGRIDMDADAYSEQAEQVIEYMMRDLDSIISD